MERITAILLSAIMALSTCMSMCGTSVHASENSGAVVTETAVFLEDTAEAYAASIGTTE